jgi:hypothetical protein
MGLGQPAVTTGFGASGRVVTAGCGLILDRNRGSKNSHLTDRGIRLGTDVSDDLCEPDHTRLGLRAIFSIPEGLILGMGAIQVTSSRKGAKSRTHGRKRSFDRNKGENARWSDAQAAQ